jgi:hypothetical protein
MGDLVARPPIVFESGASVGKSRILLRFRVPRRELRGTPTPKGSIVLRNACALDAIKVEARRINAAKPGRFA